MDVQGLIQVFILKELPIRFLSLLPQTILLLEPIRFASIRVYQQHMIQAMVFLAFFVEAKKTNLY